MLNTNKRKRKNVSNKILLERLRKRLRELEILKEGAIPAAELSGDSLLRNQNKLTTLSDTLKANRNVAQSGGITDKLKTALGELKLSNPAVYEDIMKKFDQVGSTDLHFAKKVDDRIVGKYWNSMEVREDATKVAEKLKAAQAAKATVPDDNPYAGADDTKPDYTKDDGKPIKDKTKGKDPKKVAKKNKKIKKGIKSGKFFDQNSFMDSLKSYLKPGPGNGPRHVLDMIVRDFHNDVVSGNKKVAFQTYTGNFQKVGKGSESILTALYQIGGGKNGERALKEFLEEYLQVLL